MAVRERPLSKTLENQVIELSVLGQVLRRADPVVGLTGPRADP